MNGGSILLILSKGIIPQSRGGFTPTHERMPALLTGNLKVAYNACVDEVFKALSDPARRMLLDRLYAQSGQTLGALCDQMGMTRQAVTKHLAILEAANLVVALRRGREKLHYLNPVPIHDIHERWIDKYERVHLDALRDLKRELETGVNSK